MTVEMNLKKSVCLSHVRLISGIVVVEVLKLCYLTSSMKVHFVQYIGLKPDQKFMLGRKKVLKGCTWIFCLDRFFLGGK